MMNKKKSIKAQSTIEFTFAMVAIALLIFCLIKTFRWVGMDYAQGAYSQEQSNIFVHPGNACDKNNCFSLNVESEDKSQRLDAYSRNF